MWLQSQAAGVASRGSHNKKNYNLQSAAAALLDDKGGYKYDPARCKQVSLERLRLHLLESGVEAACFSNYSEPQPGAPAQPPAKSQRLSSTNASRSTSTSLPENEPLKPQPSPVRKKRQDTPPAPPLRRPSSPLKSALRRGGRPAGGLPASALSAEDYDNLLAGRMLNADHVDAAMVLLRGQWPLLCQHAQDTAKVYLRTLQFFFVRAFSRLPAPRPSPPFFFVVLKAQTFFDFAPEETIQIINTQTEHWVSMLSYF
jgi:hypothetical protein